MRLNRTRPVMAGVIVSQVDFDKLASYGGDHDYQGYHDYYGYAARSQAQPVHLSNHELQANYQRQAGEMDSEFVASRAPTVNRRSAVETS